MANAKTRGPFEDTSVAVSRSQGQLRDLLKSAGATGIQTGEDFERGAIELRFGWVLKNEDAPGRPITVKLQVVPLEPEKKPGYRATGWKISPEQRERQAWRGLYWYLKAMLDAAQFGLLAFEDVFLSFVESTPHGPTVGEVVLNQLQLRGRLELSPPRGGVELTTGEGTVVEVIEE